MLQTKISQLKELTAELQRANYNYEVLNQDVISNKEYDSKYDQLKALEEELGIILPNSPTQKAGYEVVSQLNKIKHSEPMLSLDKTKDIEIIANKFTGLDVNVSYKLDGLTVVLTYDNGRLQQAVTRGNGLIGEDVTHTIKHVVPNKIPVKNKMILRGEAVISYKDFERINNNIPQENRYKNPRNLASGTVRSLDSKVAIERYLNVIIFECLTGLFDSKAERLKQLNEYGFNVVEFIGADSNNLLKSINVLTNKVKELEYPVDGLVITVDSISKSREMGITGKFPKCSMAFKWADTEVETVLRDVEWSPSRTGLLNPVAIFDPVEIEGSTISRASLHNVSIIQELEIGIGDSITVYKANLIIPQISDNLDRTNTLKIPDKCPVCGNELTIKQTNDTKVLICTNKKCGAKLIGLLEHFVSRNCLNIDGLSVKTLEQLVEAELVQSPVDLYRLNDNYHQLMEIPRMGYRKAEKLLQSIEDSRKVDLSNFINALGIAGIGLSQAKALSREYSTIYAIQQHINLGLGFTDIDGFGAETSTNLIRWFNNKNNKEMLIELLNELEITNSIIQDKQNTQDQRNNAIANKTFVVTGSLFGFKNRKELTDKIESMGGKSTSSVTSKTDYLINNDINSTSSKNKKAKELGIPIITEQEFMDLIR